MGSQVVVQRVTAEGMEPSELRGDARKRGSSSWRTSPLRAQIGPLARGLTTRKSSLLITCPPSAARLSGCSTAA